MFKSIGKTDIGLKRNVNQDYFKIGTTFDSSWAIVCDGLGGEKAGDIASKTATEIIAQYLIETYKPGMGSTDIRKMLTTAFNLANAKIFDMGKENIEYEGMATTAIVSFIVGYNLYIAHVGDSRIYLVDNETVNQLTRDDSLVQALVENGALSEDEAKKHPKRNYLTKAIGVERDIDIYYECFEILKDSKVLMCTDGLYNYLDNKIISDNINFYSLKSESINLVDKFIQLALDGGGSDNITVVVMFDNYGDGSRVK